MTTEPMLDQQTVPQSAAPAGDGRGGESEEARRVAEMWYVAPVPPGPRGWLVFNHDYVLRAMRGQVARAQSAPEGAGLRLLVQVILGLMAAAQALLMLLSYIPVIGSVMEVVATYFPRGAAGAFVRACYWKTRLKRLGQNTLIERGVEIWGAGNIEIGSCCHLDTYARLAAGEAIYGQRGRIVIGDYVHVGPRCHLVGRGGLTIDRLAVLEAGVHVYSATNTILHPSYPGQLISLSHVAPAECQHISEAPVVIDEYAVVGFCSILMPGAVLGRGAIVHPFSLVTRPFPPFANVVGPGRAKQNGWRRPPRLDPRRSLQPAEAS